MSTPHLLYLSAPRLSGVHYGHKIFVGLCCLVTHLFLSLDAQAEGPSCGLAPNGVRVQVRSVRADERLVVAKEQDLNALVNDHGKQFDRRLSDLSPKLRKLQYRSFRLVGSQKEELPFGKRETVSIGDGNSLTLRPIGMADDQVAMWLRWEDGEGMQIIDTRMQFVVGEALIAGVDNASNSGLILAIDVQPVRLKKEAASGAAREP